VNLNFFDQISTISTSNPMQNFKFVTEKRVKFQFLAYKISTFGYKNFNGLYGIFGDKDNGNNVGK